jgi:hypothetical protein
VYREFQQNKSPLNHFARDYVRSYVWFLLGRRCYHSAAFIF